MIGLHPSIHEPPERLSLTCPLGLRFLDTATGTLVADGGLSQTGGAGLRASAWPDGNPHAKKDAIVTPSGIHSFSGLPGLRRFENNEADDPWNPPPETAVFQVEVTDTFNRFLPCRLSIDAPVRGLVDFGGNGSPPGFESGAVPLFSAPWRALPTGLAVVRAELKDGLTGRPAAWAVAEASYSSGGLLRTARGLADGQGRLVMLFAYPEGQRHSFNGSPPLSAQSLSQQQWTLNLGFFYVSVDDPESAAVYEFRLDQPPVNAWRGESPMTPLFEESLTFGRELNLGAVFLEPA